MRIELIEFTEEINVVFKKKIIVRNGLKIFDLSNW